MAAGISHAVPYSAPRGHSFRAVPDEEEGMLLRIRAEIDDTEYRFATGLFGLYNIDNVRAAMAAGLLFDIPAEEIIDAVSSYRPANNRSQVTETGRNTVIRDAYNANPSSMEKSIASFATLKADKKMVILGDMLELGSESVHGHAAVIRQLRQLGDIKTVLIGPHFREAAVEFPATLFGSSEAAAEWLRSESPEGYTILVKGSRGMMLEKVYPLL